MLNNLYEVACGTIPGRDHLFQNSLLIGKNNQDGVVTELVRGGEGVVAIVCDGCGSQAHSEVGSKLGSRLLCTLLRERLLGTWEGLSITAQHWEVMRQDLLAQLRVLALSMAGRGSFTATVADYFLFTIVGVVLTPKRGWVFSVGDGIWALNGEVHSLGPFPNNAPPYLAYSLIDSSFSSTPELLKFQVEEIDVTSLESLLVGTDGVQAFIDAALNKVPGNDNPVGALSQFWTEGRFFRNQDSVRRKLALVNSQSVSYDATNKKIEIQNGLLPDDTTLVVVRKRRAEKENPAL